MNDGQRIQRRTIRPPKTKTLLMNTSSTQKQLRPCAPCSEQHAKITAPISPELLPQTVRRDVSPCPVARLSPSFTTPAADRLSKFSYIFKILLLVMITTYDIMHIIKVVDIFKTFPIYHRYNRSSQYTRDIFKLSYVRLQAMAYL